MAEDRLTRIVREAEDGLDPVDALTPREALARILVLCRIEDDLLDEPGILYADDATVGGSLVPAILSWSHSEKRSDEARQRRDRLERGGWLSRWVSA